MKDIQENDDDSNLADIHSLGACLKSYFTLEANAVTKTVREAIGSSAYMNVSLVPNFIDLWSPMMTLEGDSVVMF